MTKYRAPPAGIQQHILHTPIRPHKRTRRYEMKKLNAQQTLELNGGKTYDCPFCEDHSGGYWDVYWHALKTGCFKKNKTLKKLWDTGWDLIKIGTKLKKLIK